MQHGDAVTKDDTHDNESPLNGAPLRPLLPKDSGKGIRLGGFFGPSYTECYTAAWKKLLPTTRGLALPIVYLQRHTFELLVKGLLQGALATRAELYQLDELFGTALSAGPTSPDDFITVHTTHSFGELFPPLEKNMAALGWPALPEQFAKVRQLLDGVDEGRPDRLRYETMFSRRKRRTERSFPAWVRDGEPKYAPCDKLASLLNEIVEARSQSLKAFVDNTDPPTTELGQFYTHIWESQREAEYDANASVGAVVGATRDGTIQWVPVSSQVLNVAEHPNLKDCAGDLLDECLEARFRDRVLTIAILKAANGQFSWRDSGFYLATRRPNGTLTSGVWPDECQSSLIYEIQEAFKRAHEAAPDHVDQP
jgi:hypothetical protein